MKTSISVSLLVRDASFPLVTTTKPGFPCLRHASDTAIGACSEKASRTEAVKETRPSRVILRNPILGARTGVPIRMEVIMLRQ